MKGLRAVNARSRGDAPFDRLSEFSDQRLQVSNLVGQIARTRQVERVRTR